MAAQKRAFPLRLSADLYAEIRRWADDELRSVNGQIEFILRQALQERCGVRKRGEATASSADRPADLREQPPDETADDPRLNER